MSTWLHVILQYYNIEVHHNIMYRYFIYNSSTYQVLIWSLKNCCNWACLQTAEYTIVMKSGWSWGNTYLYSILSISICQTRYECVKTYHFSIQYTPSYTYNSNDTMVNFQLLWTYCPYPIAKSFFFLFLFGQVVSSFRI